MARCAGNVLAVHRPNIIYSYWQGSRTAAVLFDPRTDLLPEAASWGRSTDLFECQTKLLAVVRLVYNCFVIYTFIKKYIYSLFPLTYPLDVSNILLGCLSSPRIWTMSWHCDVNITLLDEPMKIRPSVNSSIAGNIVCWPINRTV